MAGYRSAVGLIADSAIGVRRAVDVSPRVLTAACSQWRSAGWPDPTIWARVRVIRSALGWAYAARILDRHPLDGMRGPPQTGVRLHAPVDQVKAILACATERVEKESATGQLGRLAEQRLHRAEQVLLLARLAADSGARRGELAALQIGDLDGSVMTISRGASNDIIGPTKTGRIRSLTLGPTSVALWHDMVDRWRHRAAADSCFGPWLFAADQEHTTRLTTSCLGRWFSVLARDAGYPDVTLHRLRHTVATELVSRGDILQAQYRLGHRDAATTLKIYSHVLPLTDRAAADTIEHLYND